MANPRAKLSEVDPVWSQICKEAEAAIADEPLMGGLVHTSVLHHGSLECALAYRISMKLASPEMSDQMLREIADEAYADDHTLAEAARADLVAILERDPACHRLMQPLIYFKGYQAVQA